MSGIAAPEMPAATIARTIALPITTMSPIDWLQMNTPTIVVDATAKPLRMPTPASFTMRRGLRRRHESAIADDPDETPVAVDDRQRRDSLLGEVVDDLLAVRGRVDADRCSLDEILELGVGCCGGDLAERDGADEAARCVG